MVEFKSVGQNVTIVFDDGEKITRRIANKSERDQIKEDLFNTVNLHNESKNKRKKKTYLNKIKNLIKTPNTSNKENRKKISKSIKKKNVKEVKSVQQSIPKKEETVGRTYRGER